MTTSLYAPVASPGDVSAKNYTSLYSDSLTPPPNPSGDVTIQGNLTVRGGNIYTTATTASVFPTNATTVNAFTAATTLNLGGNTGTTTINNLLDVNGKNITLMASTTGPLPAGDEYGLIVNRGSSGQEASLIWVETGTRSTSYWNIDADARIQGDAAIQNLLFVEGDQIIGNAVGAVPTADFSLIARRGLPTFSDVSIRWNGTATKWQFTNDGVTFYDMVTGGSGGSATFGNITIAVADANTITTTTGALKLDSANDTINADTASLTANNLYANTSIVSYGALGSNGKVLTLNYDNGTDTNNGGILINRGSLGNYSSLKWDESIDTWQFYDGLVYRNMVGSDPATGDVNVPGVLDASSVQTTGNIIAGGVIGTNGNFAVLNYDDTTLAANAGLVVRRGASADVALRWNYTTNKWQFSNDGTTYYDMVSSIDDLTDVVITTPTGGQLLTYDGTNWVNNYTITGGAANQTLNLVRIGAFSTDTPTFPVPRSSLRLTKRFNDVTGTINNQGGPGLTLNVQDSTGTNTAFAGLTSNYNSSGNSSIALLTSTNNFTTADEIVNFTLLQTTFPQDVSIGQDLEVTGNITVNTGTIFANLINIDGRVLKNTATATFTSATQQVFGTVPIATFRTVKYTWQISRGTEFQALETLVTHDGTTAHMTAYADVRTGSNLADFNVDISGGNMRILVTPTSAASTVIVCDVSVFYI